jgi:pimeloyl-ACP methyl ester carboxylesterase
MITNRREFLKTATATAVLTATLPLRAKESRVMQNANFADVNGVHMFYSVHGDGKPLILLHGGINPDSFGSNLAEIAKRRRVIAPHLQGHGRTPDTNRPLRVETLADDIAAFISHLKLGKADVMGYSFGASVALQTAIHHPDVVDRLVVVATRMRRDGAYPEVVEAFNKMEGNAEAFGGSVKASPLGETYPDVDWVRLFKKVAELGKLPFDWSADVAKIRARTLLVFADADMVPPEHMVEFWKALGGGQRDAGLDGSLRPANQFAVVPNATHHTLVLDPRLPEIVEHFLGTE